MHPLNRLMTRRTLFSLALACALTGLTSIDATAQFTLESTLMKRSTSEIARRAHVLGDPSRGAIIFYRQGLSCIQCHTAGEGAKPLGPDLSQLGVRATYDHIIESILRPSKEVQDGFKSERILTADGQIIIGIIRAESNDELRVIVPGEDALRRISLDDVDARVPADSMMPMGLINQLSDEAEFFDLVSFLVELGKAGPQSAASLVPDASLIAPPPLPEYEKNLDHAGMIRSWNRKSLKNGEVLYKSLCVNCHGTKDEAGSLPNALRFASGKFRGGSDPHSMYKTITHGYKMMLPQRRLVPQQKYDVIHYIRETYLKPHNASQYTTIDDAFLASLPQGKLRGPTPVKHEPWRDMDYGPFLISTYEMVGPDTLPRPGITKEETQRAAREGRPPGEVWPANTNFAYKGIAVRLDDGPSGIAAGSHWMAFDHDTMRIAGAWAGTGFIDWKGILFNGNHAVTPRTVGELHFGSLPGPGWAHPVSGSFDDPRMLGKDGRAYGPLPRDWARYKGLYKHGNRVVVSYSIGDADVLETHAANASGDSTAWIRTLNVGKSTNDLTLRVAPEEKAVAAVSSGLTLESDQGYLVVRIPAERTPVRFDVRIARKGVSAESLKQFPSETLDLRPLTLGGPSQWSVQETEPVTGNDDGPFAVDTLSRPTKNPWKSRLRMSGLDFFEDGDSLVACCCDGDVWVVDGIRDLSGPLRWKRIASGLFHPLGIKIVSGRIFVTCRDQIVILNDLNGDGETDFYECFNNDHQVTDHFHEFAMGLQADANGNLYYAKSARHARDSLVPQHGTLLRVSADGTKTTIVAKGFRAANGVCLNPDGSYFVTDQEGHWNPMNRINRVTEGGFYGNMYGYGAPDDSSDGAMEQPLCWPNKSFDRSPSELLWVNSDAWGPLNGSLLNLSYGYGKVYVVPHEKVGDIWQGGMCRLPLPQFPTGVMRARFHPGNGQMYACGMHAWGSDQSESPGGLYRIRYTGAESLLPIGLAASTKGMTVTFTGAVDSQSASDPKNYLVDTWGLKRTANYGSDLYDEQSLTIDSVEVSEDGRSVTLRIPQARPTWCMQISYKLKRKGGNTFTGTIQNTVHQLAAHASTELP
jgi:putative heme-binding domain-containing protein